MPRATCRNLNLSFMKITISYLWAVWEEDKYRIISRFPWDADPVTPCIAVRMVEHENGDVEIDQATPALEKWGVAGDGPTALVERREGWEWFQMSLIN